MELLTNSRLSSFRRCQRQHHYRYELGLSRIREAPALRFGTAYHAALAVKDAGVHFMCSKIDALYEAGLEWMDDNERRTERMQLSCLLEGYHLRYQDDDARPVASEAVFTLPLINPVTKRRRRGVRLAGKIDRLEVDPPLINPVRYTLVEYKTCGEDIDPNSDYWLRLRQDPQLSMYVLGARALGYDVTRLIYDVTRKPTIRQRKNESLEEYGDRLSTDIAARPEFYYQRREVPRLEADLERFGVELYEQAEQMREARKRGWTFRNPGKFTCPWCEFSDLCLQGVTVDMNAPPPGYQVLTNVHPELEEGGE